MFVSGFYARDPPFVKIVRWKVRSPHPKTVLKTTNLSTRQIPNGLEVLHVPVTDRKDALPVTNEATVDAQVINVSDDHNAFLFVSTEQIDDPYIPLYDTGLSK